LVEAEDEDDLLVVAEVVLATGIDTLTVGKGSNMLVSDDGFAGLAITLGGDFADSDLVSERPVVSAGSAVSLPVLARQTAAAGLAGFEWAVGVPGSIGGAVRMNAGGHGSDMASVVESVRIVDLREVRACTLAPVDLEFAYRQSSIGAAHVVCSTRLVLVNGDAEASRAEIAEIVRWRRENQPGGQNCGSVFTNPVGDAAGRLVEAAGAKGLRIGTAQVSDKHANFIQADPGGLAADVVAVIRAVRRLVKDDGGVALHPELQLVGFGDSDLEGLG